MLEKQMAQYTTEDIRNFVLVGHSGAGKTSLAEALLHSAGQTNRLGSVDEGTSILDADDEEKQRKCSIDPGFGHRSLSRPRRATAPLPTGYPRDGNDRPAAPGRGSARRARAHPSTDADADRTWGHRYRY